MSAPRVGARRATFCLGVLAASAASCQAFDRDRYWGVIEAGGADMDGATDDVAPGVDAMDGDTGGDTGPRDGGRDGAPPQDARTDSGPVDPGPVITLRVVRIGDGSAMRTSAATPVFLEDRRSTDGAVIATHPLPTSAQGRQQICTLSGNGLADGALTLSADGAFTTLACYAAPLGTASVTMSSTPRVVARVDRAGVVDTSTIVNGLSSVQARTATSVDGSAFWVGGASGGLHYVVLGSTGASTIVAASPVGYNQLQVVGGGLYGSSSVSPIGLVRIGDSAPPTTTETNTTPLPGFAAAGSLSSFGFAAFDASGDGTLDTIYVADDRAVASGGGLQKWTLDAGAWTRVVTFTDQLTSTGVRGVTGVRANGKTYLYATTATSVPEPRARLLSYIDDGINTSPPARLLATAEANTILRGIALAPTR